jgi:hypothetical protein
MSCQALIEIGVTSRSTVAILAADELRSARAAVITNVVGLARARMKLPEWHAEMTMTRRLMPGYRALS